MAREFQPSQDHALAVLGIVVVASLFCYTGALLKGAETKGLFEISLIALGALSGYARRDNTSSTLQLIEAVRGQVVTSPVSPEPEPGRDKPITRRKAAKREPPDA